MSEGQWKGKKRVLYYVLHIISSQHDVPNVVDHSDILSNIKAIMTLKTIL